MKSIFLISLAIICSQILTAQQEIDPKLTEVWQPEPKLVTPGKDNAMPPSDAIILFDGKNLDQWISVKDSSKPAGWMIDKDILTVKKGTGNIQTRKSFLDYQLHIEWRVPVDIAGSEQERGNSGIFLASTGKDDKGYELQVLDSYNNKTYVNGQAASVYKQYAPLANAMRKPGEWQTYDIIWTAPRFNIDSTLKTPARVTVFHNGVLVQNNVELKGETVYRGAPSYKAHGACPIKLQDHGDKSIPISFRNIWVREL